jgi:predicted transcriptional regulator
MQRFGNPGPTGFLGTLNRLSGTNTVAAADPEQVKRMVLQRLQAGPADLKSLAELSLPMSAVEAGLAALHDLGLIQITTKADGETYALSDYAAKALTYITPA